MGHFEGRCGRGKVEYDFDPPQDLKIKVTVNGDCHLLVSATDKGAKPIQTGGKDALDVANDGKEASAAFNGAAHVTLACGKEPKGDGTEDEAAAADKKDCKFDYDVSCGCSGVVMQLRASGETYDKKAYSDYEKELKFGDGTKIAGTARDAAELGALSVKYQGQLKGGADVDAVGFFTKTEFEVDIDAPCKIVEVKRTRKTLPDHNVAKLPDGDDGPPAHSIPVKTDQQWIITDAAGFITDTENPDGSLGTANKIYHKQFTIAATFQKPDGTKFKQSTSYEVLIKTDAEGKRKR